ncbi:hypothetical protein A3Q56_08687 [Intoshia linei]|uniref:Uncharacterized protein n=1 Tax=Intoshia linei TaxID=1819745 RepID=A0A177ANH4_9BILA|nr:hypothetical protein A3Q56_08687 [Intoshia linei]
MKTELWYKVDKYVQEYVKPVVCSMAEAEGHKIQSLDVLEKQIHTYKNSDLNDDDSDVENINAYSEMYDFFSIM